MRRSVVGWICISIIVSLFAAQSFALADDDPLPGSEGTGTRGAVSAGGRRGGGGQDLKFSKAGENAADAAAADDPGSQRHRFGRVLLRRRGADHRYDSRRRVVEVLAGQGAAPRLATREYFATRGGIPGKGLEPAAVPAAFDACITLLDRYGTLRLADVAVPAAAHARPRESRMATAFGRGRCAGSLTPKPVAEVIASRGLRLAADYFYRGPLARELALWCEQNGGPHPLQRTSPRTRRESKSRCRSNIAATRSLSAAPGRKARTFCRPCACSKASISSRWGTIAPRRFTSRSKP